MKKNLKKKKSSSEDNNRTIHSAQPPPPPHPPSNSNHNNTSTIPSSSDDVVFTPALLDQMAAMLPANPTATHPPPPPPPSNGSGSGSSFSLSYGGKNSMDLATFCIQHLEPNHELFRPFDKTPNQVNERTLIRDLSVGEIGNDHFHHNAHGVLSELMYVEAVPLPYASLFEDDEYPYGHVPNMWGNGPSFLDVTLSNEVLEYVMEYMNTFAGPATEEKKEVENDEQKESFEVDSFFDHKDGNQNQV